MKIIPATYNKTKRDEIRALLSDLVSSGLSLQMPEEAGIEGAANEDPNGTLKGNALLKARYMHGRAPSAIIVSDDTGLDILALGNEPGINAAGWGGEELLWQMRTAYCLGRMHGIEDRRAIFRTAAVVILPNGEEKVFMGEVDGSILEQPRFPAKEHMPYSPLFVPDGHTKCWAEMSDEEENAISHRGKAFSQVRNFLTSLKF